ncbi:ubiquitin-like protein, putative [Plasmodium malariae]|uniref:Ubiquitin-like protein n=2 Tax=Plasmodium (Plasmodium) TaxID=418103 RepID=A0A1A8X8X3_PLAMA|nr:ubiquitin-like protein, putative [Plasmodium malariae]SBT01692.1 ubiquitin-like protein [Plasmodium malariae]SCP03261.1 ubiquitin-like protein, putative [Plasmodium malariae]
MEELSEMYKYKNNYETKSIYIKGFGNFLKKVEYEEDDVIREVLKRNGMLCENNRLLYQIRSQLIDLDKTFEHYKINSDEMIYILPEPAPLPYLIYLFHQKSGRVHCIELNHQDSVDLLHKQVEKHLKIKEEDQILIYSGRCLNNTKTLKEEEITRESLVTILDKNDIPEIEHGSVDM